MLKPIHSQRLAEQLYVEDERPNDTSNKPRTVPDDEELKEAIHYRLDSLGYRVGLGLAER